MEKYHKNDVAPIERENERDEYYNSSNPQIDRDRTKNNYHTILRDCSYTEYINKRIAFLNLPTKPRKDAVVMNSFVIGSDKDFFDQLQPHEQRQFFLDCTHFFAERYGVDNIISSIVHMDETTPHMHLNIVPINNNRLSSKSLFDRNKLSQLQTDFHKAVAKKYTLQRGIEGNQTRHLTTAEYKASKIINQAHKQSLQVRTEAEQLHQQAEQLLAEQKVYKQALNEAQSGEQTNNRQKLKDQVTALIIENAKLKQDNARAYNDNKVLLQETKKITQLEQKLEQTQKQLKYAKQLINNFVRYEYPTCKRIATFFPTLMAMFTEVIVPPQEQRAIRQQYSDEYDEQENKKKDNYK